jgi:hypothetical protein
MATAKQLREYREMMSLKEAAHNLLAKPSPEMAEERVVQKHASIPPNQPAVTITEVCAGNGCQILITVRRKLCDTELDFLKDNISEKVKAFFDTDV